MKHYQLKARLLISIAIGILAVWIYNSLLAEAKPTDVIHFSNVMNILWKSMPLIGVFLFCSIVCMTLLSIPLLFEKSTSKQAIVSIGIGIVLVLITSMIEFQLRKKISEYKTFDTTQVVELYEKIIEDGDVEMISKLAVHPNLPDSIQEKLSDSNIMDLRKSIALHTHSEKILKKLSNDKEWEIRLAVVINRSTPNEIFEKLRNDSNEYVRNTAQAVAQNKD